MDNITYEPIDCHFYDELEAVAVKKTHVTIVYTSTLNKKNYCEGLIVDFIHINKAEYLVMENGFKLRLDTIIKLNNIEAPTTSCNKEFLS